MLGASGTVRERVRRGDVVFLAGNHEVAHEHAPGVARRRRARDRSLRRLPARPTRPKAPSTVCPSATATRSHALASSPIPAATSRPRCWRSIPLGPLGERIATVDHRREERRHRRRPQPQSADAVRRSRRRRAAPTGSTAIATSRRSCKKRAPPASPRRSSSRRTSSRCGAEFSPTSISSRRAPIARDEVEALYVRFYAGNPFVTVFTDGRVPQSAGASKRPTTRSSRSTQRDGVIHIFVGARQPRQRRGRSGRAEHEHHARTSGGTWTRCSHRRRLNRSGSSRSAGGLGAVPGRAPGRRARRDQEAQDRSRADRARGAARLRRSRHDQRDQGRAADRVDRSSRIRRRADARDRREFRLRQRLHGRARPARRARDRAPSGDAAGHAADASRRRIDRRDRRVLCRWTGSRKGSSARSRRSRTDPKRASMRPRRS